MPDYYPTPFTVLIDTREQLPYRFDGMTTGSKHGYKPLVVKTKRTAMKTGDYTIEGFEDRFTIERKSIDDFHGTVVHNRDRFKRELDRMSSMDFACVVIESSWQAFETFITTQTNANARAIRHSCLYWPIDYGVHFHWAGSRTDAMKDTLLMCTRYWAKQEALKDGNG